MPSLLSLLIALVPCLICFYLYRLYRHSQQQVDQLQQALSKQQSQQHGLERSIEHKQNKLNNANARLFEAVARHEINQELIDEAQEYLHSILNAMPSILIGITADGMITHWNRYAERATGISAANALGTPLATTYAQLPISQQRLTEIISKGRSKRFEHLQIGVGSLTEYHDMAVYPLHAHQPLSEQPLPEHQSSEHQSSEQLSSEHQSSEHQSSEQQPSKHRQQQTAASGAVIRIDDVTARVNLENNVMQHEKLTSLGELAAGLAHELNNPLGVVLQSLQTIDRRLQSDRANNCQLAQEAGIELEKLNRYLEQQEIPLFLDNIKQAGNRASQIIHNMLEFSHANNLQHRDEDIIELIESSLSMTSMTMQPNNQLHFKDIIIRRHYPDTLPRVCCGSAEIQQVLLNLFKNTCQALGDDTRDQPPAPAIDIALRHSDEYMIISIKDNGPGILAEAKRHIFNPFFTTKAVGHGTGLGLSLSYFIISKRHGGTINVESEAGQGCEFIIQLPLQANHDAE
ncbi:PAS domain-containing protein [Sinobacterium caligoides]|uniref:histidine kinase n=1 Tax=Sinobacterium caligoides TaxID=933926 RepID=A0A3N2DND2_9GAMM|nr:ATP-binding protein [Sinobacterium caligoides]ROS01316.1 PAS domain-containing protein [Sinobacterium caligoides]